MRHWLTIGAMAVSLVAATAYAQNRGGRGMGRGAAVGKGMGRGAGGGMGRGMERGMARGKGMRQLLQQVGLSSEQIERLDEIRFQARRKTIDLRAELRKAHLDLRHQLRRYDADRGDAMGKLDKIQQLKLELHKIKLGARLDARKVMTEEQWEKLRDLRGQRGPQHRMHRRMRHHRFGPGMGRGMGRGMGPGWGAGGCLDAPVDGEPVSLDEADQAG